MTSQFVHLLDISKLVSQNEIVERLLQTYTDT